jgi:D-aspartate ligase
MKFDDKEFIPVLLGGDISNYSMARSFYEAYKVKSLIIGKHPIYPTIYTKLVEGIYDENIEDQHVFLSIMDKIDKKYKGKKKILLGNLDNYVRLIIETKDKLSNNFITPFIDKDLFDNLVIKEKFYNICEKYDLDYPKTYIFKCSKNSKINIELPFDFPVFVKPSDTVIYSRYQFEGKKKGYFINNNEELQDVLKVVCESGYNDSLIIQEFIPGDDSHMRVITFYVNRKHKVNGVSMAHILLEDHSPMLVGNYTAMMGDYNKELSNRFINFLEKIKYKGICHFDIKYDRRDKKYKVLEMNIRQGRNNYYTTACGCNLAEYLVNDYIYNKATPLKITKESIICSIVPKYVIIKYLRDKALKKKVKKLIKDKKLIRPLLMKGDYNFPRLKQHLKSDLKSIQNYKKHYK